jgi:cell wall-associated NlpC family hydrolase
MKAIAAGVATLVTLVLGVAAVTVAIVPTAPNGGASDLALGEIPGPMLAAYEAGSATCPGLPWPVLAAIGASESHHGEGRVEFATGDVAPPIVGPAIDGRPGFARIPDPTMPDGWAHALGAMQFLSTTWRTWGRLAPGRPIGTRASVQNAWDSIYSAAAYLCGTQGGAITDLDAAILSYNHSPRYLADVLAKAIAYGLVFPGSASPGAPSDGGASAPDGVLRPGDPNAAVAAALTKLGVPYVYGATGPNAFDCSGLTQWAYRQAGVTIPRVTYDQVRVGIAVPLTSLAPGDLLFTRGDVPVRDYGHVAIYIGNGLEVVAPHTGDIVKITRIDPSRIQSARRIVSP